MESQRRTRAQNAAGHGAILASCVFLEQRRSTQTSSSRWASTQTSVWTTCTRPSAPIQVFCRSSRAKLSEHMGHSGSWKRARRRPRSKPPLWTRTKSEPYKDLMSVGFSLKSLCNGIFPVCPDFDGLAPSSCQRGPRVFFGFPSRLLNLGHLLLVLRLLVWVTQTEPPSPNLADNATSACDFNLFYRGLSLSEQSARQERCKANC